MAFFDKFFKKRSIDFSTIMTSGSSLSLNYDYADNGIAQACIKIISSNFSKLPIAVHKNGQKVEHNLSKILNKPNEDGKTLFYDLIISDYYNKGNVYIFKTFVSGKIYSFNRLNPDAVKVQVENGKKFYIVDGKQYTSKQILHISSRYGFDGIVGKSIFEFYKKNFQLANGLHNYFNSSFNNFLGFGKKLIVDISKINKGNLTAEQKNLMYDKFVTEYSGALHQDKAIIKNIPEVEYQLLDMGQSASAKEQQLSENSKLIEEMVCKLFSVPVSFLQGGAKEEDYQLLIDNALYPLMEQFLDSFNNLFDSYEQETGYVVKSNYNALIRTAFSTKISSYVTQINNGILSLNEVREMENLSLLDAELGDIHWTPANLLPLNKEVIDARIATQKKALIEAQQLEAETDSDTKLGDF